LRDQTQVSDRDSVTSIVEVAAVRVRDVVKVRVLLFVECRVVVHGRRVVNLLGEPPEVDVSLEHLFPVGAGKDVRLDQLVRVEDEGGHAYVDVELGEIILLNLELLLVDLSLRVDSNLPETDFRKFRQSECSGQDTVVQLLRLPLANGVTVGINNELRGTNSMKKLQT